MAGRLVADSADWGETNPPRGCMPVRQSVTASIRHYTCDRTVW
jgi:hypothetical protein